jgi:hypothetical protein
LEDYSCLQGKKGTRMEDSLGWPFISSREERGIHWEDVTEQDTFCLKIFAKDLIIRCALYLYGV